MKENPLICVGLEPAEGKGSNKKVIHTFRNRVKKLNLENVNIIKETIENYNSNGLKFDIISANFSLHHIILSKKNLLRENVSKKRYRELFLKIYDMLENNGIFIIKEISKYHLSRYWPYYGRIIGNDNIDWRTKHNSKEYIRILIDCGFKPNYVIYKIPYPLNRFKFFLSNPIARFFLDSTYFIIAKKNNL